MAKDSGSDIGTIIGLGIAGVGVWWLGTVFGWWGGTTTTATTTSTSAGIVPSTTPTGTTTATVTMQGPPTQTINNALQALFVINGQPAQSIAVIPGGDAYNGNGQDITATLAAEGVTPAQLYALMQAAMPTTTTPTTTTSTPTTTTGTTTTPTSALTQRLTTNIANIKRITAIGKGGVGLRGLGQTMVFATRRNYVPRGARY